MTEVIMHPIQEILKQRKQSKVKGVFSICTANETVIEAAMEGMLNQDMPIIIEATANQVNQYGGYTGLQPHEYRNRIEAIAERLSFPKERIVLGGDHLGPLVWTHLNETEAMAEAEKLIEAYVLSGFSKIHIDTSMKLASDQAGVLDDEVIVQRGIQLLLKAEATYQTLLQTNPTALAPVYIVGSEVPIPGGAQEEEHIEVTDVHDFHTTVSHYLKWIKKLKLEAAWSRVIAVVVQPGVEFGDNSIHRYDSKAAQELIAGLERYPQLVFEGHSTDYQNKADLRQLIEDSIAILKVGPALTHRYREALFALNHIENDLIQEPELRSNFMDCLIQVMKDDPKHWIKHYHGNSDEILYKLKYSYSDRSRYYMSHPKIQSSIAQLYANLTNISLPILSQFMPIQYERVKQGKLKNEAHDLVKDYIIDRLKDYMEACVWD
jgi:D-tagatose-1,6-bisphosphate aldolase subunit GatZ/KbaZ